MPRDRSPEAIEKRRRNRRRRLVVYGGLAALLVGFYYYQPNRIDFIPRRPPPYAPTDPDSAKLFSEGTRVTIVTAHPDDAEFFLGGTLMRLGKAGASITLIVCTDGDKSYYPWENGAKLGRIRQAEQAEAFNRWHGSRLIFLGYPDGRLRANDDVKERLLLEIVKSKPEFLLSFDPDYPWRISHGDHRTAGAMVEELAPQSGARWLMMFQTIAPNFTVDISRQWGDKTELLALHKSQWTGKKLQTVTAFVESMADEDGARIHAPYGESFRSIRI